MKKRDPFERIATVMEQLLKLDREKEKRNAATMRETMKLAKQAFEQLTNPKPVKLPKGFLKKQRKIKVVFPPTHKVMQ